MAGQKTLYSIPYKILFESDKKARYIFCSLEKYFSSFEIYNLSELLRGFLVEAVGKAVGQLLAIGV